MAAPAHTPDVKRQSLRFYERRLNRPASRLIYDVEFGNAGGPVPLSELLPLLKDYLARPIEHNDVEPKLPIAMSYYLLKEGSKISRTLHSDDVPRGMDLMLEGMYVLAADGGRAAQAALVDLATKAANIVRELSETRSDEMAVVAAERDEWPATVSDHPDWETRNAAMIKAVKLGGSPDNKKSRVSALPPKTPPRRPVRYKQESRHVRHIFGNRLADVLIAVRGWGRQMKATRTRTKTSAKIGLAKTKRPPKLDPNWLQNAIDLPELDDACADQWFEVAWQALESLTAGRPESLVGLDKLGRYKANYRAARLGNTPGVERGGKREGIKERLKDNFAKHVIHYPRGLASDPQGLET